jgi:hypothetical protein
LHPLQKQLVSFYLQSIKQVSRVPLIRQVLKVPVVRRTVRIGGMLGLGTGRT